MANGKVAENSKSTAKRKPTPASWKPGVSGNPGGRPKNEISLTAIAKRFLEMKPNVIANEIDFLKSKYQAIGKGNATMGELVIASMLLELVNNPQPGNLRELWKRIDGEVDQTFNINDWRKEAQEAGYNPDELVQQFASAMVAGVVAGSQSEGASTED
jgi:hypothetical protein